MHKLLPWNSKAARDQSLVAYRGRVGQSRFAPSPSSSRKRTESKFGVSESRSGGCVGIRPPYRRSFAAPPRRRAGSTSPRPCPANDAANPAYIVNERGVGWPCLGGRTLPSARTTRHQSGSAVNRSVAPSGAAMSETPDSGCRASERPSQIGGHERSAGGEDRAHRDFHPSNDKGSAGVRYVGWENRSANPANPGTRRIRNGTPPRLSISRCSPLRAPRDTAIRCHRAVPMTSFMAPLHPCRR